MFKNDYQKKDALAQISGILSFIMLLIFVFVSIDYGENFSFIENWNLSFSFIMIFVSLLASIFFLIVYMKNSSSETNMRMLLLKKFWLEKTTMIIEYFNDSEFKKALDIAKNFENQKNEELIKEIENLKEEFSI